MKLSILVLVLVALTGCATTYLKPGASNQARDKDLTDCQAKFGQAGFPRPLFGPDFIDQCMSGAGWSKQ